MSDTNFQLPYQGPLGPLSVPYGRGHLHPAVTQDPPGAPSAPSVTMPGGAQMAPPSRAHPARPDTGPGVYRRVGKRAFDIAFVLLTAPVALLLIAIGAALLWVEGGRPFYTQARLGAHGTAFSILKLRTMVRNADALLEAYLAADPDMRKEWETTQKLKKDPRITPVGSFLRKTSMDELPQLWNVLRGEMSIVGPRPMMPDQLPLYGDPNHYFALRPGITGSWQVSQRNESAFASRAGMDAAYDASLSFLQDIVILLRTVGVVLRRTGY